MMNRKDFYEYIKDNVKNYLPPAFENAKIELTETIKVNDVKLTSINIVRPGEHICPAIYLNGIYDQYREGKDLDSCVGDVADYRIEYDDPDLIPDISKLIDYENVKGKLQVRICDPELNQERLNKLVHNIRGDYAAIYYVNLNNEEEYFSGMPVTNEMFARWNISKEQLHADAMAADKNRGPLFCVMSELMDEMFMGKEPCNMLQEKELIVPGILEMPMYCLTNGERSNGASLIFHDDILEKIGAVIRSDYYVLPSSLHEVLILPDSIEMSLSDMTAMVREINEFQVAVEDRLSDKIQFYSRESKVLENAQKREDRLTMERESQSGKSIKERMAAAKKEMAVIPHTKVEHRARSMEAVM